MAPALQLCSLLNEHAVTVQALIPVSVAMMIAPRMTVAWCAPESTPDPPGLQAS
jgi:anaerobic C4-dicarboxylate transporter